MFPATRIIRTRIDTAAENRTLIDYLAARFNYHSRERWLAIIAEAQVQVNGQPVRPDACLHAGDILTYTPENLEEPPVDFSYSLIYEDEYLFVINKSGNLPCHPAGPFFRHTLWHHLSNRYGKVYLVNRLDRETSGLLIAAKDSVTAGLFAKKAAIHEKAYMVLVFGDFRQAVIADGFLIKDEESAIRKKRRFVFPEALPANAKKPVPAGTLLEPVSIRNHISLVKATLKTGRFHQLRATLYSLGFPVVGDKLYGPDESIYLKMQGDKITAADWEKLKMRRQAVHAYRLVFTHPVKKQEMEFTIPLPPDFIYLVGP
ncbi:MAG: RluA family pseudouridine synthase [Victivallales bacterium]|nr:RluA family pseudouridine synthase [Victivallales bacterium]